MYLDSLRPTQGGFRFEENRDVNNRIFGGNPIQSTLHMILNPRFLADDVKVTLTCKRITIDPSDPRVSRPIK